MKIGLLLSLLSSRFVAANARPTTAHGEICHGELCYPSIFEPTNEFAVVHDDQSIPPGLRVRINMETGVKEARLLSPEELVEDDNDGHDLTLVPGESVHESKIVADEDDGKPFPPTKPLQGSDRTLFGNALEVLSIEKQSSQDLEEALDVLEDLVHELEFGLKLVEANNFEIIERLLVLMESSSPDCRAKSALVLGSALQNNMNAILAIPKHLSLQSRLLELLTLEHDDKAKKMLLYALSASMAQKDAKKGFLASNGHQVLFKVYSSGSNEIQAKIASFIEDQFAQLVEHHADIYKQADTDYEASLNHLDALERWCHEFQASLLHPLSSIFVREKLLSAVSQVKRANMDSCSASPGFLGYLAKESLAQTSDSNEAVIAIARSARSLFGNTKASRKHGAAFI